MKHFLMSICIAILAVSAGLTQERKAVPPPPKPADEGPSLEVTMKFIQDKLNSVGPVNFVIRVHDNNATGNDSAMQFSGEVSKVVANPSTCRIDYHSKSEQDGSVVYDSDTWFSLKAVDDIVVMSMEQRQKELNTGAGHPSLISNVEPPIFLLNLRRTIRLANGKDGKTANSFSFSDEQLANRVAKAMVHAVELCGGGAKPEPF